MKVVVVLSVAVILLVAALNGEADAQPYPHQGRPRSLSEEKVCEPGSSRFDGCNSCTCTLDGLNWGCTRKLCEKAEIAVDLSTLPVQHDSEKEPLRSLFD